MSPTSFLLLFLLSATSVSGSDGRVNLVPELTALRGHSPSGVIRLDDNLLSRYLLSAPTPRLYSLVIFFDAASHHSKPELNLPELRSEFALISAAASDRAYPNLFFCDIEFKDSRHSFSLFGVRTVPHVRFVSPTSSPRDSDPIDQSGFTRLSDSISELVEFKTGITLPPITRPPPISIKYIVLFITLIIIATVFLHKRVLTIVRSPKLWCMVAVSVYFFGVSGTMNTIIKKTPMWSTDRSDRSKLIYFYQGSGKQLGAEGFIVGFLYTVVGLLMAFVTHVLVKYDGAMRKRGLMLAALLVSCWAVSKVISLDNWKTGYSIHGYWPSRWNRWG